MQIQAVEDADPGANSYLSCPDEVNPTHLLNHKIIREELSYIMVQSLHL